MATDDPRAVPMECSLEPIIVSRCCSINCKGTPEYQTKVQRLVEAARKLIPSITSKSAMMTKEDWYSLNAVNEAIAEVERD